MKLKDLSDCISPNRSNKKDVYVGLKAGKHLKKPYKYSKRFH